MPLLSAIMTGGGTNSDTLTLERICSRVILCPYGRPVGYFESRERLLAAFRDAIKGHCGLSRRAIVHQDVGLHNILLGAPDAPDGHMGVLVDHDIGPSLLRDPGDAYVDCRTGTRAYQSIQVLESSGYGDTASSGGERLLHDYLDDLESFYWSLCWISFTRGGSPTTDHLRYWNAGSPIIASNAKCAHLLMRFYPSSVKDHFKAFVPLLKYLHDLLQQVVEMKSDLVAEKAAHERDWDTFREEADATYPQVIEMFDRTINKLKAGGGMPLAEERRHPPARITLAPLPPKSPPPAPREISRVLE
ncbi:hypothetical protein EV714DRAFT_274959 [Schizophyllum commune]